MTYFKTLMSWLIESISKNDYNESIRVCNFVLKECDNLIKNNDYDRGHFEKRFANEFYEIKGKIESLSISLDAINKKVISEEQFHEQMVKILKEIKQRSGIASFFSGTDYAIDWHP